MLIYGYIAVSCVFLCLVVIKPDSGRAAFLLKFYCVCAMPLSIEALIRSIVYVRNVWGRIDYCLVAFTVVSVLVLCLCVFALSGKFSGFVTREIYFRVSLALAFMISLFPLVSFVFEASLQIISVWWCAAAALFALSQKYMDTRITKLIVGIILLLGISFVLIEDTPLWVDIVGVVLTAYAIYALCDMNKKTTSITRQTFEIVFVLALWMLFCGRDTNPGILSSSMETRRFIAYTIEEYCYSHPEIFSERSPEGAVDITEEMMPNFSNLLKRYIPTGVISIFVFQRKREAPSIHNRWEPLLKYNTEAFIYAERGVLPLFGLYGQKSSEQRKKELSRDIRYFNSPKFDSFYDGISDVFYGDVYNHRSS